MVRKMPIGIQTFAKVEGGCYYVDKDRRYVDNLADGVHLGGVKLSTRDHNIVAFDTQTLTAGTRESR